jgi:hypothetical protein
LEYMIPFCTQCSLRGVDPEQIILNYQDYDASLRKYQISHPLHNCIDCNKKFTKTTPNQKRCLACLKPHSKPLPEAFANSSQKCLVCPQFFTPVRREQQYCSPQCRLKAWKAQKVVKDA